MGILSDPWKLVPLIIAAGTMVAVGLKAVSTQDALVFLGVAVTAHAGISAVNNPPNK